MRVKDKVALVTGAGRGIGLAVAQTLVREGARVAVCDYNPAILEAAMAAMEGLPGQALPFCMDVSRRDQIDAVVEELLLRFGSIDILVNNAGIYEEVPAEEISEAQWDRLLSINLKGAFFCCQAVIPAMKRQKSGRIINMGSMAGEVGGQLAGAHYSVSKAGLLCLAKQLARELGAFGITANAVAPGRIDTPLIHALGEEGNEAFRLRTPLGRLGTAQDVANAVLFLASDEASFVTGEVLDVNGGLQID